MLLESALRSPSFEGINALKKLRSIVREREGNRWCITVSGSSHILASLMNSYYSEENDNEKFRACEEALGILYPLLMTQEIVNTLIETTCIRSMDLTLHKETTEAGLHAAVLLQKVSTCISD